MPKHALTILLVLLVARLDAAPSTTLLIQAVKDGDVTTVRRLVKTGMDVNVPEIDGTTALHWAASATDITLTEVLLAAGAQVNASNRYGVTPLSAASMSGNPGVIRLLLKAGADARTALPGGETALMSAARTGSLESVAELIAHGADVNAKESRHGQTALMWAAAEGHAETVSALLKAGAAPNASSEAGFTALLFAARDGRMDVARALLAAGANPNEALPVRRRPATALPAAPIPTQVTGGSGLNAFLLASWNAHYELAIMLLDAGADPNSAPLGWTALHQITAVRKVGLYGSNDPAPEGSGNISSLEFVRLLVAKGANVNARATARPPLGRTSINAIGATPFLLAARTADAQLMRELVKLGADPLLPNADGTSPLLVAAGIGTAEAPEDPGTEPEVIEAIKVALELGNDINAVDGKGETAMHGAAYKQLPGAIRFLAANGAKIQVWNQMNRKSWTPLKITQGVRIGNAIQQSAASEAAVREVMLAAGVEPVVPPESTTDPQTALRTILNSSVRPSAAPPSTDGGWTHAV